MSSQPWSLGKLTRKRADGTTYWSYCIKFTDEDGNRCRMSLSTQSKEAGYTAARLIWQQRTLGSAETVGVIVEAYIDSLGGLKDEKRKREAWLQSKSYWADLRPCDIDDETSAGYLAWRKRSVNTMRNELAPIRTALNWAVSKKLLDRAPKIVVPAIPESSVEHLSKAEFRQFLTGCRMPHVTLFAILSVTTGARPKHLLQLKWDQIDMERALADFHPKASERTNKGRATVPLNDRAMDALREAKAMALSEYVIEVGGVGIASIKKGIDAASVRAKVHCSPGMFRHTAAVWMAEDRTPMEEIARFLGHKNTVITTRVYARFNPDYLRRAARSLDW